jgi:hypothetical protein
MHESLDFIWMMVSIRRVGSKTRLGRLVEIHTVNQSIIKPELKPLIFREGLKPRTEFYCENSPTHRYLIVLCIHIES